MNATSLELLQDLSLAEIEVPMTPGPSLGWPVMALAVTVALFSVDAPRRLAAAFKDAPKASAYAVARTTTSYPVP